VVLRVNGIINQAAGRDIMAYATEGDSAGVPLLTTDFDEHSPRLSPDGRWLAYVSDESGRAEVFVRPFPDVESGRWQVSIDGGAHPLWKRDGTELYYFRRGRPGEPPAMHVAHVRGTQSFETLSRERLFDVPEGMLVGRGPPWEPVVDVTADGGRFLTVRVVDPSDSGEGSPYRLVIIENLATDVAQALAR